jgi:hypothetical protein
VSERNAPVHLRLHSLADGLCQVDSHLACTIALSTYIQPWHQSATMSRAAPQSGSRKISFNVSEQYDIQDVVGEGAYGVVWYAISLTCVNVKLD